MELSIILDRRWKLKGIEFVIDKDILFQKISESNVYNLYEGFIDKIGDGIFIENDYAHILVKDDLLDDSFPYWHTPYSIVSEICNILVFCNKFPLTTYSIITSKDGFKTIWTIPLLIHYEFELYEALTMGVKAESDIKKFLSSIDKNYIETYSINEACLNNTKICYGNLKRLNKNKRVRNAFDFFFNAWHSHQLEHICINLSIVLESLFSPNDNRELVHQISFNASHFIGGSNAQKEKIYDIIKDFYNIRSRIVHGGNPKYEDLSILTSVVFIICCDILRKLYLNTELADEFESSEKRNSLFKQYMFS